MKNWKDIILYHYGAAGLTVIGPLGVVLREANPWPAIMGLTVTDSGRIDVHPSYIDVQVGDEHAIGLSVETDGTDLEELRRNLKSAVCRICGCRPPIF